MAIMTHAKFHFNHLMLALIFGIWASEPRGPEERLKRLGLIESNLKLLCVSNHPKFVAYYLHDIRCFEEDSVILSGTWEILFLYVVKVVTLELAISCLSTVNTRYFKHSSDQKILFELMDIRILKVFMNAVAGHQKRAKRKKLPFGNFLKFK